jgi:hypothetical protein
MFGGGSAIPLVPAKEKARDRSRAFVIAAGQRLVTGTLLFGDLPQHLLPGSDRFTLPLGARFLVVLALLQLGQNPRLLAFPLEAAKRVLECLVFFDVYERHSPIPPFCRELWRELNNFVGTTILGLRGQPVNGGSAWSAQPPVVPADSAAAGNTCKWLTGKGNLPFIHL